MAARTRKSQANADREVSQVERLGAENAQLLKIIDEQKAKLRALSAEVVPMDEYRRVQALLRVTQIKLAQLDRRQSIDGTPRGPSFKERCLAYFAATGNRSVTATELRAWENANAQD